MNPRAQLDGRITELETLKPLNLLPENNSIKMPR